MLQTMWEVIQTLFGFGSSDGNLERSGKISVIPFSMDPQVVEVSVQDGVQVVRIELK